MFREFLCENKLENLLCAPGSFRPFPLCSEREVWQKLSTEKKKVLLHWGEDALNGYPQITATQFMAYCRTGERRVFENPYFARRTMLFGAVMAECVENEGRFLDAIIDGLWLICEESTWAVSAHNNYGPEDQYPFCSRMLPDVTDPCIDLFAAQTASVLAYVLYFMAEKLDAVSPLLTARVRYEIDKRILHPFLHRSDYWWMGYGAKTVNNWNPWILSNVIDTALIVETSAARRSQAIGRAMIMLDHYLAVMPQDGGCDEGAGYFNVGGGSLLDCLESLYCASNGKINFYCEPHIGAIGSYPEKVHVAGAYYLNFADCDAKPFVDGERVYTYGMRTGNRRLMELGQAIFTGESLEQRLLIRDTPQVNRSLFSLFNGPEQPVSEPQPAPFMQLPDLQVYSWFRNGVYTAIKGGHNAESHNHNDVGSFVVYADGMPEIVDMGNKVYTAATFGPDRYQLNNTRSMNHNVPLIGSTEQHAGRGYEARDVKADETGAVMELAGAYPEEAKLESLERSLQPQNDGVILRDRVQLWEPQTVTWVFMLRNQPVVDGNTVRFGKLAMQFDNGLAVQAKEMPVDDQRMQRSFPGSLWRLTFETAKAAQHQHTFVIKRM